MSNAPWKKTWNRVAIHETTKMVDEGKETKKERAAWQACGSKDTPKEKEPTAPKEKQESEAEKEAREEATRAKRKTEWLRPIL